MAKLPTVEATSTESNDFTDKFIYDYSCVTDAIEKFRRDDLIVGIITVLKEADNYTTCDYKERKPMFWTTLTLFKLVFEHAKGKSNIKPQYSDFVKLYNMVYSLESEYDTAIANKYGLAILLTLAHRQFWAQQGINRAVFARLYYIFALSSDNEGMHSKFSVKHGVTFRSFCEMLAALWVETNLSKQLIYELELRLSKFGFTFVEIKAFLKLLTIRIDDSGCLKRPSEDSAGIFFQFGKTTPFVYRPIIKVSDVDYAPISSRVVDRAIELLPLQLIRDLGDERLRKRIATRYEHYIANILSTSGIVYSQATTIEKNYTCKSTDFLILNNKTAVMLEVKSIHLKDHSISNPSPEVIPKELSGSIVKAIRQGMEFSSVLSKEQEIDEAFLVIVTYGELYLGDPSFCWYTYFKKIFAGDELRDHAGLLSYQNVYIVSAHQVERILSHCSCSDDLINLLKSALVADAEPNTRKHSLDMHL